MNPGEDDRQAEYSKQVDAEVTARFTELAALLQIRPHQEHPGTKNEWLERAIREAPAFAGIWRSYIIGCSTHGDRNVAAPVYINFENIGTPSDHLPPAPVASLEPSSFPPKSDSFVKIAVGVIAGINAVIWVTPVPDWLRIPVSVFCLTYGFVYSLLSVLAFRRSTWMARALCSLAFLLVAHTGLCSIISFVEKMEIRLWNEPFISAKLLHHQSGALEPIIHVMGACFLCFLATKCNK